MVQNNSDTNAILDLIEGVAFDTPDNVNPLARAEDALAALGDKSVAENLVAAALNTRDGALWRLLRGRQLSNQGQYEHASAQISKALAFDDTWYLGHGELALHLSRQGRKEEAAAAAMRSVELNPNYADGYLMLGTAAFGQRRFDDAAQAFQRFTELNPETESGYYFLGRALLMVGNLVDARVCLQRAQSSATYGYRALIRLGQLAKRDQDKVSALSAFLGASYIQPSNPFSLVYLSRLSSEIGLTSKGVEYAKQAVKLSPKTQATWAAMAQAYVHAGRVGMAIKIYQEMIVEHEGADQDNYVELATLLFDAKKWNEMGKTLETALEYYPRSFELTLLKGRLEQELKNFDAAVDGFAHASQMNPEHMNSRLMWARALTRAHRDEEALRVLEQLLELNPTHGGARALISKIHTRLKIPSAKVPDSDVDVENIFRFRPEQAQAAGNVPALLQMYNHFQAITAYVIRETKARYITQKMGYFAAILESAIMLLMLLLIFKFIRNKQPGNMTLEEFLLTGLIMLNFVTLTMGKLSGLVKGKRKLMMSPQITSFTLRVGESFIIAITNLFVAFVMALGFNLAGIEVLIVDLPQVAFAVVLAVLMGAALGIIFEALTSLWKFVKIFQSVVSRLLFFTSGVFFSVDDLPVVLQEYVLLNPLMHLIEFVRHGFEPTYPMHGVSFPYVIACVSVLFLLAFLLDKRFRGRVLAQ